MSRPAYSIKCRVVSLRRARRAAPLRQLSSYKTTGPLVGTSTIVLDNIVPSRKRHLSRAIVTLVQHIDAQ
jgi:hypothetical protein